MIKVPRALPDPNAQWFDPKTGRLTKDAYDYWRDMDAAVRKLIAQGNPVLIAALAAASPANAGNYAFASNGRKNGETASHGTGVLVFSDGAHWIAVDTGATVAA